MNRPSPLVLAFRLSLAIGSALSLTLNCSGAEQPPLTAGKPILLEGTHGGFDFIEVDQASSRLLATHTGNGTLDIFDTVSGKLVKSCPTGKPQGVVVDSKAGKYYVSVSSPSKLVVIDAKTLEITGETPLPAECDVLTFDSRNGLAYVSHDDAKEVWAIDVVASKIVATIPIPEGPEGMVYDAASDRVYVNAKKADSIVSIEPNINKVVETWSTAPAKSPHGLAIDRQGRRLFIAGANGKLAELDVASGRLIASCDIAPKVDQIAFDPALKRVYCASGTGVMSVVEEQLTTLLPLGTGATHKGAHSVAVDEKTHDVWTAYAEDGQKSYLLRLQ